MARITLFDTLRELGLDDKINGLVQAILHNTTSKVKFRGQISESFNIRMLETQKWYIMYNILLYPGKGH